MKNSSLSRIFPIVLVLGSFMTTPVSALDTACVIKNGMSKELSTYIQTVEKLRGRLEAEASKHQCSANGQESASANASRTTSSIIGAMNESIGFSNFSTSGRFYIDLALRWEIPAGITRDHELLGQEITNIKNTIEMVHNQCAEDEILSTNLSDDSQYTTTGKSVGAVLKEVLQNQVELMNFYRETVLGDDTSGKAFILVWDSNDFSRDMKSHYGPVIYGLCNAESDFFAGVRKSFGRIANLWDSIKVGMNEWEAASELWKKAIWMNSNTTAFEYAETERNVLRAELGRQGVSTKTSAATMNCLARYNSTGLRCGIVGGFSDVVTTVNDNKNAIVNQFEKTYASLKSMLANSKTTDRYMDTLQAINILKVGINTDIVADYANAKNLIGPENLTTDETVGDLIDTHILLESTNAQIKSYVKIAEQTCNDQSRWDGNCIFR